MFALPLMHGMPDTPPKCSKLNSPFVVLLFRIADTDGMVRLFSFPIHGL